MTVKLTRAGVVTGLRSTLPLGFPVATFGMVYGVLAQQAGVSALEATLLNIFVFAGAAQMAVLQYWQHPLPIIMIAVTTFLINFRLVLLSASMRPWLKTLPNLVVYPMLHHLSDESWSVSMMRYRLGERDAGVVLGSNLIVVIFWLPSTILGFILGTRVGDPQKLGLDFAFTAVFAALLFSGYRSRRDIAPWLVSGIVAAGVWWAVPGTWYIVAGGLAGLTTAVLRTETGLRLSVPDAERVE